MNPVDVIKSLRALDLLLDARAWSDAKVIVADLLGRVPRCDALGGESITCPHCGNTISERRLKELLDALAFIAGQGCVVLSSVPGRRCKDLPNRPCVTEYCLPCFAAAALESDAALADWQDRRKGLADNQT